MSEQQRTHFDVFSTYEFRTGNEIKNAWIKVGAAFMNKDGSYNIRLRALPITDAKSGTANLHMRLALPKEAKAAQEQDYDTYVPIDPIDGAPIEDL